MNGKTTVVNRNDGDGVVYFEWTATNLATGSSKTGRSDTKEAADAASLVALRALNGMPSLAQQNKKRPKKRRRR